MKILILSTSILISLLSSISFAQNNNEPSLSEKIKNSYYYKLDSKVWDFLEEISFDDLINDNKWNSSLNFKRSIIDYNNNRGVLIDTTSLPITWNIFSKDIKDALPDHLPSELSVAINYNLSFGLIAQRVLVISEKEEFKKQTQKDWVFDIHKELLKTVETSPTELKEALALKNNISNSGPEGEELSGINTSPTAPDEIRKQDWKQRASSKLINRWDNFLYQLNFDFSEIQYEHFFSRFLTVFRIPIRASLAKKMAMQETISYTGYGVHSLGPSFTRKGKFNLNIQLNPYYIIRNGQYKVQVLRLDPLNSNKVLLKFSHLVSKGTGSGLGVGDTTYLVERAKDLLKLNGGSFIKKALVYHITPIFTFSKNQKNLSVEEKTQSYEFDLSDPKAAKAYNYAAIGMTHKTEEIAESLKHLGDRAPVKIRQKSQLRGKHDSVYSRFDVLGSTYKLGKSCEKQFNKTNFSFVKAKKKFLNVEGNISCNKKSSLIFFNYTGHNEKEINYISGGVLQELNTSNKKKELYLNATYAYEFKSSASETNPAYYESVKEQIEYFNLISTEQVKFPCPEYKKQTHQTHDQHYNWNSTLTEYNKIVDQCIKTHFKTAKIQVNLHFSQLDITKFYLQSDEVIIKAIQTAFAKYIDSAILQDITSTPYLEKQEQEEKIKHYKNNIFTKNAQQFNYIKNVLENQYNLLEKTLLKGIEFTFSGLERLGLPYNKELRLNSAIKQLFTAWKKIKIASKDPNLDKTEAATTEMAQHFSELLSFPEFSKEYIHFLSIISERQTTRSLYLKHDGIQLLNK